MYIVTITYLNAEGATFDFDYYHERHLPMVGAALKPFGLGYASVLKGEASIDGAAPAVLMSAILSFPDEASAKAAMQSEGAHGLSRDVPNFTSIVPIIQWNRALS